MSASKRRIRHLQGHLCSADTEKWSNAENHGLPFDPREVEEKYKAERDMRLKRRPEGTGQYIPIYTMAKKDPRFSKMLSDPWTKVASREPKTDTVEVAIIGAGYGGLCAGAHLVMEGIDPADIRMVDSAGDAGGTWYWNRYPGAMCDVESYTYMPLLEQLGYIPTEKYAHQPELQKHCRMIMEKYGLYQNALFSTKCTGLNWDDESGLWTISSDRGDVFRARFVFMNFGTLTNPKLPGCDGISSFKGHVMHTSRWDYEYTGGDSNGGLTKLRDKRVAIIGTGATAVQAVPHLGAHAKQLYVFQRTPSSVDVRNNRKTTQEFITESLSNPGWQKERMDNFTNMTQTNIPGIEDLIQDGWTKIMRNLNQEFISRRKELLEAGAGKEQMDLLKEMFMIADMKQMHEVRTRAETVVHDSETSEALKPWYQQFCKRPCFHDEYLPTFNRPNVSLIHDPLGVEAITERGVVSGGVEYEVDLIVFATGFEIGFSVLDPGYPIVGRDQQSLAKKWEAGPRTLRSMNTHGFPNLFMQNAPQGTFTVNFVQKLDEEAQHAAFMISRMKERGLTRLEAKKQAEDEYVQEVYDRSGRGTKFLAKCTPGYYNREGSLDTGKSLNSPYCGPINFFQILKDMREQDSCFEDFDLV